MKKYYLFGLFIFLSSCSYNVTSFVGAKAPGYSDGKLVNIKFHGISSIKIDSSGNLIVADTFNNRIRKIISDGTVITIAGSGNLGSKDGIGENSDIYFPSDIVIDKNDIVYLVSSQYIRTIDKNGNVKTIGKLSNDPSLSLCGFDSKNNLYFLAHSLSHKENSYYISTLSPNGEIKDLFPISFPDSHEYYCRNFNEKSNKVFINVFYPYPISSSDMYIFDLTTNKSSPFYNDLREINSIDFDKDDNIFYFKEQKVYKLSKISSYKESKEIASFHGLGLQDSSSNILIDKNRNIIYIYGFYDSNEIFKVQIKE